MSVINVLLLFVVINSAASQINLLNNKQFCGFQHTDDYYRDNDNIAIDEFPWMAQILYNSKKEILCTGSLINYRYVLTAAHCIVLKSPAPVAVRLGDFNITSETDCIGSFSKQCSDPVMDFDIEEMVANPGYVRWSPDSDIGLIRLSTNVEYSDYIRPICLASSDLELTGQEQLVSSGWGLIGAGQQQTEVKKKIFAYSVSLERCREQYWRVSDHNFCVFHNESRICTGDNGGPLMISTKKSVVSSWSIVYWRLSL